jgi:hypothetical protein
MEKQKKIKRNTLIGDIQEGRLKMIHLQSDIKGVIFNVYKIYISRERHSFIFIKVYGFAKCRLWDGKTEKN